MFQGEATPFKPFLNRFPTPYRSSNSTSALFYAVKRGPAHIIVLSSYSAYGTFFLHESNRFHDNNLFRFIAKLGRNSCIVFGTCPNGDGK